MKYVFTENTKEAQEAEDAVLELEYSDLLTGFDEAHFESTSELEARSFASMQLRARNAIKSLLLGSHRRVMMLCGCSYVDTVDIAKEIITDIAKNVEMEILYAPSKQELFGEDGKSGAMNSSICLIIPCSVFIDHPKWIQRADAAICQNSDLKLVLCGDGNDCATLNLMWPTLDNSLRSDIALEFSNSGALVLIGSLISYYQKRYGIKPFTREAVRLLCTWSCRQSGDRRYLGILENKLRSLVMEADRYSKETFTDVRHVLKAIAADDYRVNSLSEYELRNHRDNQILLDTRGEVTGQINGLSVIETAGTSYEYGEPVRITATLRAGGDGDVIDIEHKADLAGQIHTKAMMIINGFLATEFGSEQPMPVSASLVFEQSYSEIDGDSASLTGLCAVISCFADLPIRQDLAVTGAVDQFGDVQSVGGVNEKIEGFFRICKLHGLTGTQGVIIPCSCIYQLVLRPSVLKAVKQGLFHIYVVGHVTGASKVLMKTHWGEPDDAESICGKICARLDDISAVKAAKPWWHLW
ncbi:MAG: Lon-insertion domain-containing protein [Succinivibrio sp.]